MAHGSVDATTNIAITVALVGLLAAFAYPPNTLGGTARRFGLIILVCLQLKQSIDQKIGTVPKIADLEDQVAVVTGANSGIGLEVTTQLVMQNMTVFMACKDLVKCRAKAGEINEKRYPGGNSTTDKAFCLHLDLADLGSVKNFADELGDKFKEMNLTRLDLLINNAGLVSSVSGHKTEQGWEALFGIMHLGHFALTHWLKPFLLEPFDTPKENLNKPSRVINIASEAFLLGNFQPSFMTGNSTNADMDLKGEETDNCQSYYYIFSCCPLWSCPHTNGYARAKLGNVLHAKRLQEHFEEEEIAAQSILTSPLKTAAANGATSSCNSTEEETCSTSSPGASSDAPTENVTASVPYYTGKRRVLTASLHPGSVYTSIHFIMEILQPFLRTPLEASAIVLSAVGNIDFVPGSYIDSMKHPHFWGDEDVAIKRHLQAYANLEGVYPKPRYLRKHEMLNLNRPSFVESMWKKRSFVVPEAEEHKYSIGDVAERLWKVSLTIVEEWEKEKDAKKLK